MPPGFAPCIDVKLRFGIIVGAMTGCATGSEVGSNAVKRIDRDAGIRGVIGWDGGGGV